MLTKWFSCYNRVAKYHQPCMKMTILNETLQIRLGNVVQVVDVLCESVMNYEFGFRHCNFKLDVS